VTDPTERTEPAEHDDVRRVLAEARHDDPIPTSRTGSTASSRACRASAPRRRPTSR
jgi:hypothetical protein